MSSKSILISIKIQPTSVSIEDRLKTCSITPFGLKTMRYRMTSRGQPESLGRRPHERGLYSVSLAEEHWLSENRLKIHTKILFPGAKTVTGLQWRYRAGARALATTLGESESKQENDFWELCATAP